MLGKTAPLGKCKTAKSWHPACNQSNPPFTNALAHRGSFVDGTIVDGTINDLWRF
jgi:hypothetical protein